MSDLTPEQLAVYRRRYAERRLDLALWLRAAAAEVGADVGAAGRIDAVAVEERLIRLVWSSSRK